MMKKNGHPSWDDTLGKRDQETIAEPMGLTLEEGEQPKTNPRNPERRIKGQDEAAEA